MRLALRSLTLSLDATTGTAGVAGALSVQRDDGTPSGVPDFALGVAAAVPQPVKDALAGFAAIQDGGLWMHTDPARTDQRWFVQLRERDTTFFGEASPGALAGEAFTLSGLVLRLMVEARAGHAQRTRMWLAGRVTFDQNLGPIRVGGLQGEVAIDVDVSALPHAERAFAAPSTLLDAGFSGTLSATLAASRIELVPGVELRGAALTLVARAACAAGTRDLRLTDLELELTGDAVFAGSTLRDAVVTASLAGWVDAFGPNLALECRGTFEVAPALAGSVQGGAVTARALLSHSGSTTSVFLLVPNLRLAPALNVLEIAGEHLRLEFTYDSPANAWRLLIEAEVVQSWTNVARRLRAARLVAGDERQSFPDLRARMRVLARQLPTSTGAGAKLDVVFAFAFVRNGRAYRGRLGALPIDVADAGFELSARFENGAFAAITVQGSGRLSAARELAAILPFRDVQLGAAFGASAAGIPSLVLTAAGLPAFTLPPLRRGQAGIALFEIASLRFELGQTLGINGAVSLLPGVAPQTITQRLGLPQVFDAFVQPIARLLQGSGTLDLQIDASGRSGSVAITFARDNAPVIDPFAILRSLFPSAARAGAHPLNAPLLEIQPVGVAFRAAFHEDEASLLELSGIYHCAVLGESFDARFTLRMAGVEPEMVLAIGVDDPVRLTFPAADAFNGRAASSLLDDVAARYTLTAGDRAHLINVIQALSAFFQQPGMNESAAFDLSHVELVFRPTDAAMPLALGGTITPVRLPEFVQHTLRATPSVRLGTTARSVYLELQVNAPPGGNTPPLLTVPMGPGRRVDFVLHGFSLAYAWDANSIDTSLALDVNLHNLATFSPQIGSGVNLPQAQPHAPSIASTFSIRTIAAAPPVPVPEWGISFGDPGDPNNVGAEFIVGIPQQRVLTTRVRRSSFSLTRTLFGPGADFDGAFLFGNPPPGAEPSVASHFYVQGRCIKGTFITLPVHIGALINPLALIPPFLTPVPPYWVIPPLMMGDYFFDRLELTLNIPGVLFGTIALEKPLPTLSLAALVELAFLASKGFAVPLADESPLFAVFFVRLTGVLEVPMPTALFGTTGGRPKLARLVALDFQINAADSLRALTTGVAAARQALDTAQRGLEQLRDDPALLIRIVPRQHRQCTFDLALVVPGLSMSMSASAFLLTPEELHEELVLYHESQRPAGKGAARMRRAQPPRPRGPVVDQIIELIGNRNFAERALQNPRDAFDRRGKAFRAYQNRKTAAAEQRAKARVSQTVASKIAPRWRAAVEERIFRGAEPLLQQLTSTDPGARATRRQLLEHAGFAHAADEAERLYAAYARRPSPAAARQIGDALRDFLVAHPPLTVRVPLFEGDAAALAKAIVAEVLVDRTGGTGRPHRFEIVGDADDDRLLRTRFAQPEQEQMRNAVRAVTGDARARLRGAPPMSDRERTAFRVELENKVEAELRRTGERQTPMQITAALPREFGISTAADEISRLFVDRGQRLDLPRSARVFDFHRGHQWFDLGRFRPQPVPPDETVREVTGYRAVPRPDGPFASVVFSLDVPGPNTTLQVRLTGGRYVLLALDARRQVIASAPLPAAITSSVAVAPGVAARLRREFAIVEAVRERQTTAQERQQRDAQPIDEAPDLYQDSLLARPEYAVKPQGGRRGPLTLADLLRNPADGSYIVPRGPVLIAGAQARLFRRGTTRVDIGMAGLIAPATADAGAGVLLRGHHDVELPLPFGYVLKLEGDFHLVVGDMWPATLSDPEITRNSMSFVGIAALERNGREVFRGEANGHFRYPTPPALPAFSLSVKVRISESWEAEVLDTELTKAWIDAQASFSIEFEGSALAVSLDASLSVTWQVATFATKRVRVPAVTLCVPNPLALLPGEPLWLCEQVGGDTIDVPDPTTMTWGPEHSEAATLKGRLDTGSGDLGLEVRVPSVPLLNFSFSL